MKVSTLRNWEKRYGVVVATRNGGLQRLYSPAQIEQLRLLKRWTDAGLSAAEAHERLKVHSERLVDGEARGVPAASIVAHANGVMAQALVSRSQAIALREDIRSNRARARAIRTDLCANGDQLRGLVTDLGETITSLRGTRA